MLKNINRFLKYVGLNLVHAKKPKAKIRSQYAQFPDSGKCVPSPTCCVDEYNAKKSPYTGAPVVDDCMTHYVGDNCKPAHVDASPTQDNKITGPTS